MAHNYNIATENAPMAEQDIHNIVMRPYYYLMQDSGKNFRTKLLIAVNDWLKVPNDKLKIIFEITECLHNCSVLIDDVEDNSPLRRGRTTAHLVYGLANTINSSNYLMVYALELIESKLCQIDSNLDQSLHSKCSTIYRQQLIGLHKGQGLDIHWRDDYVCPTEEQYIQMVHKKTGGMFGFGIKLMQIFTNKPKAYALEVEKVIDKFGIYFQIRDDYMNLTSEEYTKGKGLAEDLTEGKLSFPLIHSVHSNLEDKRLLEILRKKPEDEKTKLIAIGIMTESGSLKYTLNRLKELKAEIHSDIKKLGENQALTAALEYLYIPDD